MILLGISTTVGAINFIVTFLRLRCPGMSINRVPILIWGTLTASAANIFAIPAVSLAFFLLWMDRNLGTHFFDVIAGGSALLWQHLFWMFGHPWVYAIVLPAMGMVSDGLAGVLPPSAGRLHSGSAGDGRHHGAGLWRLGAPHVRHRPARRLAVLLQRRLHHYRGAQRCGRFRLARDHLDWDGRSSPPPSCSSPASSCCSPSAASPAS